MRKEDGKMRRLYLCALLCALVFLCLLAQTARAEMVSLGGIVYELKDGYAFLAGFEEGMESITVHSTVNGYPVLYGAAEREVGESQAKEVVIAEGETGMNISALLSLCPKAERIILPATLLEASAYAAHLCKNLKEFVVPGNNSALTAIDGVLFSKDGKTLLCFPEGRGGHYDIPQGTTGIGMYAFGACEQLISLTVPEGVTAIGELSLSSARGLERIFIPASVSMIETRSLPQSGALVRLDVAHENAWYQSAGGVLYTKDGGTLIYFPPGKGGHFDVRQGTRIIGQNAFGYNEVLESVSVPQGVTALEEAAFCSARGLRQISLPASLTEIKENALPRGNAFMHVEVDPGNLKYQSIGGALYEREGTTLLVYPAGRTGHCDIAQGTLAIAPGAFGYNSEMTCVTVPEGVTILPDYLFSGAAGLEEIYLPVSLQEIGEGALPDYGKLKHIEVNPGNKRYRSIGGVLFEGEELIFYPPAHGISYDVPPGTKCIRDYAFQGREMLETISIPRSVTEIGVRMFSGCTALARVSLPITLTSIGRSAFENCIVLSGITLPPGLVTLEAGAFYNCPSLAAITIPESVREMGTYVFNGHSPDFVLYAAQGSAGYWHAWEYNLPWAEPGGTPGTVKPVGRQTQSAVVNNASNQELLNLYAKPQKSAGSLGRYPNGTTVQVLDTANDWAHVQLYGAEGYMPLKSLMLTDRFNDLRRITWGRKRQEMAEPLRLYAGALEEAPSEWIVEDVSMRILDTVGVWYHVLVQGREGYVPVQNLYVAHSQQRGYDDFDLFYSVVANPDLHDRLHLRREPSTQSQSLGRYFNGTQVEVIEYTQDGWAHVRVDGKEGYMMVQYLLPINWGGEQSLWGNG